MRIVNDREKIRKAEAIALDCDGTIIDASMSYDLAIKLSVVIIFDMLSNVKISLGKEIERSLKYLRMTGGFNNDCDTTSTLIQTISAYLPETIEFKIVDWKRIEDVDEYIRLVEGDRTYPQFVSTALEWLISQINSRRGYLNLKIIEELIDESVPSPQAYSRLIKLRSFLNYPGAFGVSFLATLFDELFLGSEGVRKKYGWEPRYVLYDGTLQNEKLLISEESMKELKKIFPKGVVLITGRGKWETEKTISPILEYIDMEASIFTADRDSSFEKPSPRALIEVAEILKTNKLIYVGNSMEDLLMSLAGHREGLEVGFIGVADSREIAKELQLGGADAVVNDINELPKLIDDIRSEKL